MKSDKWLLRKIVEESITKKDIAHLRKLLSNGHSDDEALNILRERMCRNSKGMQSYIRHEKVRALFVKLSYRIHWTYMLPVVRQWLKEKEILIRWKDNKHGDVIDKKASELRAELLEDGCRLRCNMTEDSGFENVISRLEKAAEDLLSHIEEDER